MTGDAIEKSSFRIIESECGDLLKKLPIEQMRIARRLIHTTADPNIASLLSFKNKPIQAGLSALRRHAPIFCDSSMIRSGISLPKLRRLCPSYETQDLLCFINDDDVREKARLESSTRALAATQKALPRLEGAIVLIGNAPLALARIAKAVLDEGLRPALVVGMPVGFVNVLESKALIRLCSVPQIVINGRRGGSPLAVATLHALLENSQQDTQE